MKTLELKFLNEQGRTVTISVGEPVEPADPTMIAQAMDEIVAQNIFFSSGGDIVSKKGARIVERNVTEIEM